MKVRRTAGVAVVVAVLITGCSGEDKKSATSTAAKSPGTSQLPGSRGRGTPVTPLPSPTPLPTALPAGCGTPVKGPVLPEGWPTAFPLPANLVLTTSTESGGALRIAGVSGQTLPADASYLKQGMTSAGIEASNTETGAAEAESDFSTEEYTGHWQLRTIPGCAGHTLLIMSVVLL